MRRGTWGVGSRKEQRGTGTPRRETNGSQGEAHGESVGAREMGAGPLMRAGRVLWGRGVRRGQRMGGMLWQGRWIWRWAPCSHWAALVRWPGLCPGYCLSGQAAHVCVRPTVTESRTAGLPGHMPATPHSWRWVPKRKGIPVSKQGCGEQPGLLPGPGQAHTSPGSGPQRPPPWLPFLPSYPLYTASKGVLSFYRPCDHTTLSQDPSLAPRGPQDKALLKGPCGPYTGLPLLWGLGYPHRRSHLILPTTRCLTPFYRQLNRGWERLSNPFQFPTLTESPSSPGRETQPIRGSWLSLAQAEPCPWVLPVF